MSAMDKVGRALERTLHAYERAPWYVYVVVGAVGALVVGLLLFR